MRYHITTRPHGDKTHHACTDETGRVIDTRTTTRQYTACTVVRLNPARAAQVARQDAVRRRVEAANYRDIIAGKVDAAAVQEFGADTVQQWKEQGKYAEWLEAAEEAAEKYEQEALQWEAGTHPNPPHVIGWSSKLTLAPKPRTGGRLEVIEFATLAA